MNRSEIVQALKAYIRQVDAALILRGTTPRERRLRLKTMGAEVLKSVEQWSPNMGAARRARTDKGIVARETEPFTMTWHISGRVEHLAGWHAMADRIGLSAGSLRTALSKGRGVLHRNVFDELSGWDNVEIRRVNYKPGKGRPRLVKDDLARSLQASKDCAK